MKQSIWHFGKRIKGWLCVCACPSGFVLRKGNQIMEKDTYSFNLWLNGDAEEAYMRDVAARAWAGVAA